MMRFLLRMGAAGLVLQTIVKYVFKAFLCGWNVGKGIKRTRPEMQQIYLQIQSDRLLTSSSQSARGSRDPGRRPADGWRRRRTGRD